MNIENYTRIYNTVNHSKPDTSKGLEGWQVNTQRLRGAVLMAKEQLAADTAELRRVYTAEEVERRLPAFTEEYEAIVQLARDKASAALDDVINGKREQYRTTALSAPTDEMLRLLTALNMRDDLTEAEITSIAETFAGNVQALKSLGAIARRAGIEFPAKLADTEKFEDDLAAAERFAREQLRDISKDTSELGYSARCFWTKTGSGLPGALFKALDEPLFSSVQEATDAPTERGKGEPTMDTAKPKEAPKPVKYECDGAETLGWLAYRFGTTVKAIKENNGLRGDGDLTRGRTLTITPGADAVEDS